MENAVEGGMVDFLLSFAKLFIVEVHLRCTVDVNKFHLSLFSLEIRNLYQNEDWSRETISSGCVITILVNMSEIPYHSTPYRTAPYHTIPYHSK